MKIGDRFFSSYTEYEAYYVKRWQQLHPNLHPDLNWVKQDWQLRLEMPEHFKL